MPQSGAVAGLHEINGHIEGALASSGPPTRLCGRFTPSCVYESGVPRYRSRVHTYEIRCGRRVVAHVESHTPRHAITQYLRSLGCRDEEIEPMGSDVVGWRGAVYTAVETVEADSRASSQSEEAET